MPAPAASRCTIRPESAKWVASRGEFILPYESVRTSADPEGRAHELLQSTYEAAADRAGWDRALLEERPQCDCATPSGPLHAT